MLKISVVGLGLLGQQHLKAVKENSDCKVVSVIDKSEIAKKIAADENPAHHNTSENCYWIVLPKPWHGITQIKVAKQLFVTLL